MGPGQAVIVLIGTLDTKMPEYAYVRSLLEEGGTKVRMLDVSLRGDGTGEADVLPKEIAERAGVSLDTLHGLGRHDAAKVMIEGASGIVGEWVEKDEVQGILGLGGANGTTMATGVMRALPFGFPKVMVSAMASGQVSHYIGASDIAMISSIGDLSLNRVTRRIFSSAVGAVVGMVKIGREPDSGSRPLVAMTSFGVTQPCVDATKSRLEARGYEVMLFHASGPGGRALEDLAARRVFDGVIDLTTSELTDEMLGASFSAGPARLEAAGLAGLPQIVVPGALDLVNFWVKEFPVAKYGKRILHHYNADIVLMRASADEFRRLGSMVARKLNTSRGSVEVVIPMRGFSLLDRVDGQAISPYLKSPKAAWHDAQANRAFVDALTAELQVGRIHKVDAHVNDPSFAEFLVEHATLLFQEFQVNR